MPPLRAVTALLWLASPSPLDSAPPAAPRAVREIVDRNIAARGGLERIKAIRTLVLRAPGRFMARARPFYWRVGDPDRPRTYAEGNDGSPWEYIADPGLVVRTTDAPAAAARHTAYFDDPLVSSLEPGWRLELRGTERIGGRDADHLRATYPDGFQTDLYVDRETHLVIANRKVAPVHAFGAGVATETRIGGYREVSGVLFPTSFDEYVIATGRRLDDMSGTWTSLEANVPLPLGYFSPPAPPDTPLARMLNAAYAARAIPTDALGWYRDFRAQPVTAGIDTDLGMAAVGYQCLKNGALPAAILLLEANLADQPRSARAHFGLGRAYRLAGRDKEAVELFRKALAIDPAHKQAAEALAGAAGPR
jgi:hypothetical protein